MPDGPSALRVVVPDVPAGGAYGPGGRGDVEVYGGTSLARADAAAEGADDMGGGEEAQWELLAADCRKRVAEYREAAPPKPLNGLGSEAGPLCEGVLLKKSRFYSRMRMGRKVWQARYFVLDDDPTAPLRYWRLADDDYTSAHSGERPRRDRAPVAVDLFKVRDIERVDQRTLCLTAVDRKHKLNCASEALAQRWFDELVVKLDELRLAGTAHPALTYAEDEEQDDWWRLPPGTTSATAVIWVLVWPLKALIHVTVPEVHRPGWERYYPVSLGMAVVWLALLAYVMTLMLEHIGCALHIPSTVIGLTLGAIGTSFPNLYASVLTARAGQAGMSICQAFGSNTFNLCIGLGLVWLFEALAGDCMFGGVLNWRAAPCNGCYMPVGFAAACPHLIGFAPPRKSGTLVGTSVVVFFNILILLATFLLAKCSIPKASAYIFFFTYLLYLVYEVGGNYGFIPPICPFGICL